MTDYQLEGEHRGQDETVDRLGLPIQPARGGDRPVAGVQAEQPIQVARKHRVTELGVARPHILVHGLDGNEGSENRRSRLVSIVLHNINLKNYQHDWQNHHD